MGRYRLVRTRKEIVERTFPIDPIPDDYKCVALLRAGTIPKLEDKVNEFIIRKSYNDLVDFSKLSVSITCDTSRTAKEPYIACIVY